MGLDMNLYKRAKSGSELEEVAYWRKANAIHGWFADHCGENGYFDDGDCVEVKKEDIEQLREDCSEVLSILNSSNTETVKVESGFRFDAGKCIPLYTDVAVYPQEVQDKVRAILPPTEGFFFGPQEIGESFKCYIQDTLKICNNVLSTFNFDNDVLLYTADW